MNPIESIERQIQERVPGARTKVRRPRNPDGEWWLDAAANGHDVTIQWTPRRGFGVSASAIGDSYGEGPEETFRSAGDATQRVLELFRTRSHTRPPHSVLLKELRSLVGVTQEALAEQLGVQQAAVSRLERRDDITLSSLRRFVAALGAELEINVRMPEGEVVRLADGDSGSKLSRVCCNHVVSQIPSGQSGIWDGGHTFAQIRACVAPLTECPSIEDDSDVDFAVSSPSRHRIAINVKRVASFADAFRSTCRTITRGIPIEQLTARVLRHIVSHELGHCCPELGSPRFANDELKADEVAGWMARRLGDDEIIGAAISAALGCREDQCLHPAPEERSTAFLVGYRRPELGVNLVVLRTPDLERSHAFYSQLGLHFRKEQHGAGPVHYACNAGDTVLELYPHPQWSSASINRFGLRLPSAASVLGKMFGSGLLGAPPVISHRPDGSRVCVVRDPDGNRIEVGT